VLLVPHHGSLTSSTAAFVAAVRPRMAVFSTGYRNRYRFPRPAVAARYRALGARLLDTARDGAVIIALDGQGHLDLRRDRARRRRYWNAPAGP